VRGGRSCKIEAQMRKKKNKCLGRARQQAMQETTLQRFSSYKENAGRGHTRLTWCNDEPILLGPSACLVGMMGLCISSASNPHCFALVAHSSVEIETSIESRKEKLSCCCRLLSGRSRILHGIRLGKVSFR
jgi:hypothetical protein